MFRSHRFHLRTPAEGLQPEMTKPSRKKNRINTGGFANVCAGISNSRIVLWEYLDKRFKDGARASGKRVGCCHSVWRPRLRRRGKRCGADTAHFAGLGHIF